MLYVFLFYIFQTTPDPLLTRRVRDSDHEGLDFVEIRKLYKLDPQYLRDRYKSKLERSQRNHTGRRRGGKHRPITVMDPSKIWSSINNNDMDEVKEQ